MRLAITGATGFVGAATLEAALGAGHEVAALARREQSGREGVTWVRGSLENKAALGALCEGTDAVIHIAGLTNTPDPAEFEAANVTGTEHAIEAAKDARVRRFVFVSSLSARKPELSVYGASKAKAEELVQASKLDWTIVRPPGVYGPRDVDYLEMFKTAKRGFVPLPPGGASSIIHADDLARLLVALAERNSLKKIYEPDDGREGGWSHKELAQAIGEAVGRKAVFAPHLPRPALEMAARMDKLFRGANAKLTADRVGYMSHPNWVSRSDRAVPKDVWQPTISGEEGLRATARWYRDKDWL